MWFTKNNNRKKVLNIGNKTKGFIRSLDLETEHDKNADYNCAKATHFFFLRKKKIYIAFLGFIPVSECI